VYDSKGECSRNGFQQLTFQNFSFIKDYDTIYVPIVELNNFGDNMLGYLSNKVVIISGFWQFTNSGATQDTVQRLLDSEYVIHWFCQNLPRYGGENPHHQKISPFPYGLKERGHKGATALNSYKKVFFQSLNKTATEKKTKIYSGYLSRTAPSRKSIPSGKKLEPEAFFRETAKSRYILSPNGDRPDCYRHYEAIGLGVVPITQLDPYLYRHLQNGPVVYNITNWNISKLEESLDPEPVVNRNLIFEDYWMSWVDYIVEIELNWNVDQLQRRDKDIESAQDLVTGTYWNSIDKT